MRLKEYLTAVCPIGYLSPDTKKWVIGGTGFFAITITDDNPARSTRRTFFITAAHIIDKLYTQNFESVIGIAGGDAHNTESIFIIKESRKHIEFSLHLKDDIAFADVTKAVADLTSFPKKIPDLDKDFWSLSDLREEQVEEGNDVFLLGYPRGDNGGAILSPLVRKGVMANVRDVISGLSPKAAVAVTSAPGDSGGLILAGRIEDTSRQLKILGTLVSYRVAGETSGQDIVYGISDIGLAEFVKNHIHDFVQGRR
ncbi:MAG: hypothetical protein ACREHG_06080 [Candidatus Saccharimonadales bacterium]